MKLNRYHLISLLFGMLLVMAQLLIFWGQHKKIYAERPDLERLISIHPAHWHSVDSFVSNPAWKKSAERDYDLITARSYQHDNGQTVTVVMTWSRDGIRRAGHIQQLCYSSQGATVNVSSDRTLMIRGRKLDLTSFEASDPRRSSVEDVYYWRLSGGQPEQNRTGFDQIDHRLSHRILKMVRMIHLLFGKIPDNVMVRVSSMRSVADRSSDAPVQYLVEYLQMLSPADLKLLTGL